MGTLDEHAKAGMAAMADRKWEAAIEEFKAAIAIDDSRPDLNHAIGTAYLQRGEVMSALPHLERTIVLAEPYNEPQHQAMKLQFHMGLAAGYAMADQTEKNTTSPSDTFAHQMNAGWLMPIMSSEIATTWKNVFVFPSSLALIV